MFYVARAFRDKQLAVVVDTLDWSVEAYSYKELIKIAEDIEIKGVSSSDVYEADLMNIGRIQNVKNKLMGYPTLEYRIKTIGAFLIDEQNTNVEIPALEVRRIEVHTNHSMIKIPDFVHTVNDNGGHTFNTITRIDLGDSLREIGESVFLGCMSLTEALDLSHIKRFGRNSFARSYLVHTDLVVTPDMYLGQRCFARVKLNDIVIKEGVYSKNIEKDAFFDAVPKRIFLPSSLVNEPDNEDYLSTLINNIALTCEVFVSRKADRSRLSKVLYRRIIYY